MTHFNEQKELQEQTTEDWVFGAISPVCLSDAMQPNERVNFLPTGEVQRGVEDTMDCASRAPINILETKFNWLLTNNKLLPENKQWFVDNGYVTETGITFSDAFVAINSGTTQNGNSLKAPLEAIRKQGLIPKTMLPLETHMTFAEYHNPARITPAMRKLGKEFTKRFTINYDRVDTDDFEVLLTTDLLNVAGYAWPTPVNGAYPYTNARPNHAFILFQLPMSYAFDNYYDIVDNDFIKKLEKNYLFFRYGYRVIISKQTTQVNQSWWQKLLQLITRLLT